MRKLIILLIVAAIAITTISGCKQSVGNVDSLKVDSTSVDSVKVN